jgi:hypothetical protein
MVIAMAYSLLISEILPLARWVGSNKIVQVHFSTNLGLQKEKGLKTIQIFISAQVGHWLRNSLYFYFALSINATKSIS